MHLIISTVPQTNGQLFLRDTKDNLSISGVLDLTGYGAHPHKTDQQVSRCPLSGTSAMLLVLQQLAFLKVWKVEFLSHSVTIYFPLERASWQGHPFWWPFCTLHQVSCHRDVEIWPALPLPARVLAGCASPQKGVCICNSPMQNCCL